VGESPSSIKSCPTNIVHVDQILFFWIRLGKYSSYFFYSNNEYLITVLVYLMICTYFALTLSITKLQFFNVVFLGFLVNILEQCNCLNVDSFKWFIK
jgi:hypothetical protein